MASTFPTATDSFTDPTASSKQNSPAHSTQHINVNDAIEKIEAKVGIDDSATTTSIDYKLRKGLGVSTSVPGAAITLNCLNKNIFIVTPGVTTTLSVSNFEVGQAIIVYISAESYTVTWFSTISWPGGTAPSLSSTAGHYDAFVFFCYQTGKYAAMYGGFDIIMT